MCTITCRLKPLSKFVINVEGVVFTFGDIFKWIFSESLWCIPGVEEASASGVAMLVATSLGIHQKLSDASRNTVKVIEWHQPNQENHQKYAKIFETYKKLYGAQRK